MFAALAQQFYLSPAAVGALTPYQARELYFTPTDRDDEVDLDAALDEARAAENADLYRLMGRGLTRGEAQAALARAPKKPPKTRP